MAKSSYFYPRVVLARAEVEINVNYFLVIKKILYDLFSKIKFLRDLIFCFKFVKTIHFMPEKSFLRKNTSNVKPK